MKRLLNNNLLVKLFFSWILLFLPININSQELLDEFSETIDKINQDLDSLPSSSIEESIVIEKAIDEISSVINLVEESLNKDDAESAIKILEIMDHTISDISSIVPDEVYSDMSEMKLDNFSEDQMKEIQIITKAMNENKQQNMDSLINKMVELNKEGFNTFELINNLNDIGIDTIKIDIDLPKQDEIEKWEKKQWADSYGGSILITNDDSIITDKELEDKAVELENLLNKNAQQIETKKTSLFDFETKLSSLDEKLLSLKNDKEVLVTELNNLENVSLLSLESFKIPGSFESPGDNIMRIRGTLNFKLEDGRISKISIQDGGAMYEKIKAIYNTGNLKATKNINGEYILEIADKNLMPEYYEEVYNKQIEAINERSEKALSGGCIDTSGNSGRYYCGNDGFAEGVPGLSDPIFVDGKVVQSEIPLNRPSREELDQEFAKTFIKTSDTMSFSQDNNGNLVSSLNQNTEVLKEEYEKNLELLNVKIDQYNDDLISMNKSIDTLKTDINELEDLEPGLKSKLIKVSENLDVVTEAKANLAIASAQRYGLNVNSETIESIKTLENKSIITLDGSSLFRIVDTEALLDKKGEFSIPKGTLSVKGEVYTAGAVRPEKLFSVYDLSENNNSFQISFTQNAQDLISKNSTLQGGKQNFQGNTLGSWVLVNAATGEQMPNPLTGHKGSIVCEKSTCGIDGDFGKQAASFGGMYVLENLADENGNVSGLCNDGDCKFNVETLVVLGNNNIENNIFNENGEGLYQDDFTQRQLNEIKSFGITSEQRINAIKYAEENDLDINVLDIPGVDNDSINTQNLAVAYAEENNIFISEEQQTEGSYSKFVTNDFNKTIRSTKLYSGEVLSGGTSELAEQTFKVIDGQIVQKTAEEISQSVESSSEIITEVAKEAAVQVAEVAKEVAEVAQEAAQEVAETASTVLTGNDIEALSELANDALGYWVLVDAKTGKQMVNPLNGRTGGSVCTLSHCGADGDGGKAAAAFGGVYVLDTLADPVTGNVAGGCASGDCQYDLGN